MTDQEAAISAMLLVGWQRDIAQLVLPLCESRRATRRTAGLLCSLPRVVRGLTDDAARAAAGAHVRVELGSLARFLRLVRSEEGGMDLQTYRETSLRIWDEMAQGWEDRREWILRVTGAINEWLAGEVDPQPGESILEVAAGTGDLGFIAAERVGADGKVLCTDFSPEMLEAARRNGERRGLSNVEYRVLDAERMGLDDNSVDERPVSLGLHADGRPRRCSGRDAAGPARRRHARVRCVADAGPQPVGGNPRVARVPRGRVHHLEPTLRDLCHGPGRPHRGACHRWRLR